VFKVLQVNAGLNRVRSRIEPLNFAATEAEGTFEFHYWDASFGNGGYLSRLHNQRHGHRYPLRVAGRNLESYLREHHADRLDRLALVKTDAEGYDRQVLESMRGLLVQRRPFVVCEVHKKLDDQERRALYDVLAQCGFLVHRYVGGARPVGDTVGPGDLRRWSRFDLVGVPPGRTVGAA
jgi:FkbM family methyltransferase